MKRWFRRFARSSGASRLAVGSILRTRVLAGVLCAVLPAAAYAQSDDLRAPVLGASSNFQFGPQRGKIERLETLGIVSLRDGLRWKDIERNEGLFDFSQGSGRQISALAAKGLLGSVTLHPQHPLYDNGDTVTSDEGIAAFADYVAAVAEQFPDVRLEIANEFNGRSFVSGPARDMTSDERAVLHAHMLAAIAATGRVAPERIIGGAAHSVPGSYFAKMLAAGAGGNMGAVTIHPYSSAPEVLADQIEVIRTLPGMTALAVEITEFGHSETADPSLAADKFWKGYCAAGLAKVRRLVWYPLELRRDGYVAVLGRENQITSMGRAYLFATEKLAQLPLQELWPEDRAVRGCQFGPRTAVIWGAPREVQLFREDLTLHSADMTPIDAQRGLDRAQVMVITASENAPPLEIPRDIRLGATALIADTQDSWNYPETGHDKDFARFLERGETRLPLHTCLGQDRNGVPWVPYLCSKDVGRIVLTDRNFVLGGSAATPVSLVHRYTPQADIQIVLQADLDINKSSDDGVMLEVVVDGQQIESRLVTGAQALTFAPIAVRQGSRVDIRISPSANPKGDAGTYRLSLFDANLGEF
ncbi:MAG: hypothetical protein WBB25_00295 [Sulfitobacter sp.]